MCHFRVHLRVWETYVCGFDIYCLYLLKIYIDYDRMGIPISYEA